MVINPVLSPLPTRDESEKENERKNQEEKVCAAASGRTEGRGVKHPKHPPEERLRLQHKVEARTPLLPSLSSIKADLNNGRRAFRNPETVGSPPALLVVQYSWLLSDEWRAAASIEDAGIVFIPFPPERMEGRLDTYLAHLEFDNGSKECLEIQCGD